MTDERLPDPGRGQTTVDFVVAIGIFLLAVGFVVGFLPGMLAPFSGGQEAPLVADRAADRLASDVLAARSGPSRLNDSCTLAFFNDSLDDAGCPFDTTDSLTERAGVSPGYDLNVTVERNVSGDADREVLCGDASAVQPCSSGGSPLAAGPSPPGASASVVTASRAVHVDGGNAVLVVRVW